MTALSWLACAVAVPLTLLIDRGLARAHASAERGPPSSCRRSSRVDKLVTLVDCARRATPREGLDTSELTELIADAKCGLEARSAQIKRQLADTYKLELMRELGVSAEEVEMQGLSTSELAEVLADARAGRCGPRPSRSRMPIL